MTYCKNEIALITGTANPKLAQEISDIMGIPLCDVSVLRFADGEISVTINESIRGRDVFILQPTCPPVNESLMEILILIDALKRASAGRINVVLPYYGYARQDRLERRAPITSKLVADLLSAAGAQRVITLDLHADQIMGFFNIPVDKLQALPIIADYIMCHDFDMENTVVVAADVGSVKRSRALASRIGAPLAIVDKRRPKDNVAEIMNIIGDVAGKDVIMIDDMIDTAGTIVGAANALRTLGAKHIFAACTHGLFSGPAIERIKNSALDKVLSTNSVTISDEKLIDKMEIISIAPLLSEVIGRIHAGESVSALFE